MGCWQLLHMKQCSCQVCPLYSSLRDPARRAVLRGTVGSTYAHTGHGDCAGQCRLLPNTTEWCVSGAVWAAGGEPQEQQQPRVGAVATLLWHQYGHCRAICCNPYLQNARMAKRRHSFASGYLQSHSHAFNHSFPFCQHIPENAQETLCFLLLSSLPHKKGKQTQSGLCSSQPVVSPDCAQPTPCSEGAAGGQKFSSRLLPWHWTL